MLFGVCIGYTVLILIIGYTALVLQLRSKLRRKGPAAREPGGSIAARVLQLPPYALAFTTRVPHAPAGGGEPERAAKRLRFLRRRPRAPAR
jgi:hypothetical protein